ncbi:hypothetical protein H6P81_001582 [Aristolochia fimbriata]|uniref:GPI mannosyltransferase I n=1 Tax=Aristolochia fimbriata TaxID=158543 RepID=A0AAV7F8Y3_ARIFI|nr:hypothetical protein H6P81_001582 [Aristolochia fimbriata]
MDFSFRSLLIIAALFRLILIIYGEWQDAHMEVRYTDIDYIVFSDAASLVASGKSHFERSTYRYSPLLAYLLVPNFIIHRSWGKLLVSAADLLVGFFVHCILKKRKVPEDLNSYCVAAWLFNPFTFTIGTCGNFGGAVDSCLPLWKRPPVLFLCADGSFCGIQQGHNSTVLCVVLLPVACNSALEQYEN